MAGPCGWRYKDSETVQRVLLTAAASVVAARWEYGRDSADPPPPLHCSLGFPRVVVARGGGAWWWRAAAAAAAAAGQGGVERSRTGRG